MQVELIGLRSSEFGLKPLHKKHRTRLVHAVISRLLLALLWMACCAWAGGQQKIIQLLHTSWTARDGAPQAVTCIIRANDGGFWVGSEAGLFHFDGLSFTQFRPNEGQPDLPSTSVRSLLLAKDGALWVGSDFEGAAKIANGRVTIYKKRTDGRLLGNISQIHQAPDGSIWALSNPATLARFGKNGLWEVQSAPDGNPAAYLEANFFDSTGNQWVAEAGHLYRRAWGEPNFRLTTLSAHFDVVMAEASDGTLWLGESLADGRSHLTHFAQNGTLIASLYLESTPTAMLPVKDSLWMAFNWGLARLPLPEERSTATSPAPLLDKFERMDGLSADRTRALLRDADGNVWTGGMKGLDRFRPARLVAFSHPLAPDAWICSSLSGRVVLGDSDNHAYTMENGTVTELKGTRDLRRLSCGVDRRAWFLDHTGVWSIDGDHVSALPPIPNWRPDGITTVAEMKDHTVILNGVSGTLVLHQDKYVDLPAQGLNVGHPPSIMFLDSGQRLWLGYGHPVWMVKDGVAHKVVSSPEKFGLLHLFFETSYGIMLASSQGLAFIDENSERALPFSDPSLFRGITGGAEARNHDVWINGAKGIVRIPSSEIEEALTDSSHLIKAERVAEGDYIGPSTLHLGSPTVARDASGLLWFVTLNGVVSVDPEQKPRQLSSPVLTVHSVGVDGHPLAPDGKIDPGPQALDIKYLGVNLSVPNAVLYRYRLDGLETGWEDAGHRSEAIYTHLRPGTYRFEVMASMGDGVWTAPTVSESFVVLPHFYQTWWFALLLAVLFALATLLVFQSRLRRSRQLIELRVTERFKERARIARELHDTLLQGFHALSLRLGVIIEMIPPTEPARALLDGAVQRVDQVLVEGRKSVQDLRSVQAERSGIEDQLRITLSTLITDTQVDCQVLVSGVPRAVREHVCEEVLRIGQEALTNALRHSRCSNVCLAVDYGRRALAFRCEDDGVGLPPKMLQGSRPSGHYGLVGMSERAEKIGGRLSISSASPHGTVVQVIVPAKGAYAEEMRNPLFAPLRQLFSQKGLPDVKER